MHCFSNFVCQYFCCAFQIEKLHEVKNAREGLFKSIEGYDLILGKFDHWMMKYQNIPSYFCDIYE